MARPVSSKLSVPDVLCSDGHRRTFRYYSINSTRGVVRYDGVQITGDIRPSKHGGYFFAADPRGMNYFLLPNEQLAEILWNKIVAICDDGKSLGYTNCDPMVIARFIGMDVDEEQGMASAILPTPYNELEQGTPPTD